MLTVHVVGMLSQDVFVEFLSLVKFTHGLVQAGQIVRRSDRNSVVVMLVMLPFSFGPLQRRKKVFLKSRKKHNPFDDTFDCK